MLMATRDEKNTFSMMIEQRASDQAISCMEAILDYCESSGLEPELAATLLNQSLKCKIEEEARELRFLPRSSKLPL
jgi:Phage late-transcription coactivator